MKGARPDDELQIRPVPAEEFPDGQVVAAVRVMNESLQTVTRAALRAGRNTSVVLPRPGRYLLTGTTPGGNTLHAEVDACTAQRGVVDVPSAAFGTEQPREAAVGGAEPREVVLRWGGPAAISSTVQVREPEPGGRTGRPSREFPTCTMSLPGPADLHVTTVVPAGAPVHLVPLPPSGPTGMIALPAPGTALTLLGYLHNGQYADAAAVAEAVMADSPEPGSGTDDLADLATGQLLLLTGDPRTQQWIQGLWQRSPFRLDAAVLSWELARRTPGSDAGIAAEEVRRMAEDTLPVLSDSLRRLVRCLRWGADTAGEAFVPAADRVGAVQLAGVPGVFVAYTAAESGQPVPAADAPADWYRADIKNLVRSVPAAAGAVAVPSHPRNATRPVAELDIGETERHQPLAEESAPRSYRRGPTVVLARFTAFFFGAFTCTSVLLLGAKSLLQGTGLAIQASWAIAALLTCAVLVLLTCVVLVLTYLFSEYRRLDLEEPPRLRVRDISRGTSAVALGAAVTRAVTRSIDR